MVSVSFLGLHHSFSRRKNNITTKGVGMDKGMSSYFTLIIFKHNAGFLTEFFFKCYTLSSNNLKGTLGIFITYIDIVMVVNYNVSGKHH